MFQIDEKVLISLLKRKFDSLVGVLCERIENLEKQNLSTSQLTSQIKFDLKKDAYTAMREIQSQIFAFSEGVKITVELIKPTSK
jgi:hypothetical protein